MTVGALSTVVDATVVVVFAGEAVVDSRPAVVVINVVGAVDPDVDVAGVSVLEDEVVSATVVAVEALGPCVGDVVSSAVIGKFFIIIIWFSNAIVQSYIFTSLQLTEKNFI